MERDFNTQKNMLECKIIQLKKDLENENTPSTIWSKSQICEQNSTLTKVFGNSLTPYMTFSSLYFLTNQSLSFSIKLDSYQSTMMRSKTLLLLFCLMHIFQLLFNLLHVLDPS